MKTRQWWAWAFLLVSLAFILQTSTQTKAQDGEGGPDDQDPPGRVARLNFSQGSVSFQAAGEGDWFTAVANRPMISGDNLWADDDSRAEVHVGSTALRLGARTGITFLDLEDNATQIRLAQGSLIARIRHVDDDDTYEIDTPNIAFTVAQPGEYRFDVSEDGNQTIVTVWHGRGRVTGGGFTYNVVANQSATFTGSEQLGYDLEQLPNQDGFDAWAFQRDAREDDADSANYVSREMTGYEDLDDNGDWSYVAGYGECWHPRAVVAGWAPYRFGHWVWVSPWGWTWVEDEPWGFAPFHYGRWAFVNNGWFWVPGPVVVRPVWAPALVAFVGGGTGFHFSAGLGVGWFPLAPGEVFVPGYRVSRTYVNNVNITNTNVNITRVTNVYNTVVINKTVVNNVYANQRINGGVTVVSHDAFVNARPVAQNIMRVDPREVAAAPVSHLVQVEPVRQSVIGAGRPITVHPPAAVLARQVVAQRTPPPPPRSFAQKQDVAGGHLAQPQNLVRPEPTARPYQGPVNRPQQQPEGFRPFTPNGGNNSAGNGNAGNNQVRPTQQPAPRVYEQQGSSEPEPRNEQAPQNRNPQQPENRNMQQSENGMPPSRQPQAQPAPHPLVRPAPAVQERNEQQEEQQAQKFNQWKQQQAAQPHPAPQAQPKADPPKAEKAPEPKKK